MERGEIARNISRGAFYLAVEKAAALFSGIVYFALLLRWLGPTKYGIITLALSFVGLATMATGNFEVYLERYAAEHEAQGRLLTLRRAHRLALMLKLLLGSVASVALLALAPLLARNFNTPELATLLPLLTLIVVCDGLSTTGRAMLYGTQHFRWLSAISVAFHVTKTVMVGLLWWFRRGLPELAVGIAALTALQGLVQTAVPLWFLRDARDPEPAPGEPARPAGLRGLLRPMVAYSTPLLGARLTFISGQNLSKIVLGKLFDLTQLGYFSFAFQTVERFVELASTLPSALMPSLTQLVARGERERMRWVFDQAFRLIQVAAGALSLLLFMFAPELTRWVGSPLFAPAVPLLRILALVPFARTAHLPLNMMFQAMRRPGIVLRLALIKFAVEFGCYFMLVPILGLAGAGWANLAGAVIAFIAAHVAMARLLPEGARDRARASVMGVALLAPCLAAGLALDTWIGGPGATAGKLLMLPVVLVLAFTLGLVTRYDLEKVSSVPVRPAWLGRTRDTAVASLDQLAQAVTLRRTS